MISSLTRLACIGLIVAGIGTAGAADAPRATVSPTIVLLLPFDSQDFSRAAEAFRAGFAAAHAQSVDRPVFEVVRTDDRPEKVVAEYRGAIDRGARVIVGPMTRADISAIVAVPERVTVPTLALNLPEGTATMPRNLKVFTLALEFEARLVARSAFAEAGPEARIVHTPSALSRRSRDAFTEAWTQAGGRILETLEVDPADTQAAKGALGNVQSEAVLLAADPKEAAILRSLLPASARIYATSQVHAARASQPGAQIDGVRFVEMPWFIARSSSEVAPFTRPQGLSPDLERIYALGIDAYRLAVALFESNRLFTFNGVTGRVAMTANPIVERTPAPAQFRKGAIVVGDSPR